MYPAMIAVRCPGRIVSRPAAQRQGVATWPVDSMGDAFHAADTVEMAVVSQDRDFALARERRDPGIAGYESRGRDKAAIPG